MNVFFYQPLVNKNYLEINKNIKVSIMNHLHSRPATQSHSLNHHGAQDIKKGLEKIKQAQIEVLRELRKDDTQLSRNHSLTYSKETTLDSKPNLKFDGEAVLSKQKIEKLQQQVSELSAKEAKLRKQYLLLSQEAKKWKESASRAQYKMKEYEKSEQRALAKAQEGLANAITSQKKYINIKTQFDKVNKQRQRLTHELKRIQKKQISNIINAHENQPHISNKLVKELSSAQQLIHTLIREINNHKCVKKQQGSSSKNILPSTSVNSFTFSTFETQQKLDKNISNIILYLNALQNLTPINHVYESNNYMSGSFRDDMRKIQQQLDQDSHSKSEKINQLQATIQQVSRKNSKLEADLRELQQQNVLLKTRLKTMAKELQDLKLSKIVLEEEYEKFKMNSREKLKLKTEELDDYKSKYSLNASSSAHIEKSKKSSANSNNPESSEPLIQKIVKLQKQNKTIHQQLSQSLLHEQSLKEIIQQLESQLESLQSHSQVSEAEQNHELNKLAVRVQAEKNNNKKNYEEWDAMVRSLSKMQEERIQMLRKEKEMNSKFEDEEKKYQSQVQNLEQQLQTLKQEVEEMRRQSIALSFDQVDLVRLRNKENANKESLIFNRTVNDLWSQKEGQFNNLNALLTDISPQAKQPLSKSAKIEQQTQQVQPVQQPPPQQIIQQVQAQPLMNQYGQVQAQQMQQVQVQEEQRNYIPQYQQVQYHNNIPPLNQRTFVQVIDPYQPNPNYFSQPPMQVHHYPQQYPQQYQPVSQLRQGYTQGYLWR